MYLPLYSVSENNTYCKAVLKTSSFGMFHISANAAQFTEQKHTDKKKKKKKKKTNSPFQDENIAPCSSHCDPSTGLYSG